jgi:hypothetical protein
MPAALAFSAMRLPIRAAAADVATLAGGAQLLAHVLLGGRGLASTRAPSSEITLA